VLLDEGKLVRDVYEIDRFLGEGAFAEVYRVKHKFLGRQAMKVFKSPSESLEEVEEKLSEAIILSRIGHPNIIRVFDADILETHVGQCGYFTMEYVPGGNLETFWQGHGANLVPLSDTMDIIQQICMGLVVAHAEQPPVIHRDIKPQNILVGYDAGGLRIRVSDFGLAKKVNPLTLIASAGGTPLFMPPECLSNVSSRAGDVWAIGTIFYLLLTNRLPFPINSIVDLKSGKCWQHPLIPASHFNAQVDPALDSILSRTLALDPADRYPNARAMLNDITTWKSRESGRSGKRKEIIDEYKTAPETSSQSNEVAVIQMTQKALKLSKDVRKLTEAADLLEEALNRYPKLRERYEYQLRLWRRGIMI